MTANDPLRADSVGAALARLAAAMQGAVPLEARHTPPSTGAIRAFRWLLASVFLATALVVLVAVMAIALGGIGEPP